MPSNSIVITGLGLLTGLGLDLDTSWRGLLCGKSPIKRLELFDPGGLSCPFGVELPEGATELFRERIKKRHRSQMTRGTMLTAVAAQMAIEDAALDKERVDRSRIGVVIGTSGSGYAWSKPTPDSHRILKNMPNAPASWISITNKFSGPSFVISTACSSGTYALGTALWLISSGQCDIVISGGGDSSLNYADAEGFTSLMALSEQKEDVCSASKPFDKNRGGFVIGEGGGILVLESLEFAENRGAKIYAQMHPPSLTSETYNILSPEPNGKGMARAMLQALEISGLSFEDIDYINAHGTSTLLNDRYETYAIKEIFGDHAYAVPISSTKSMTGHCLGGAAGVEAVICCKAIEQETIPPTANLSQPDPELDLDYVPKSPRKKTLNHVMSNSFAFGGHNGVCIFSKVG